MDEERFWTLADAMAAGHSVLVDRPAGIRHPVWDDVAYPLDYGYLDGTRQGDCGGIDVWLGTAARARVTGAIVTIDVLKGDAEIKLLLGCTENEARNALAVHNAGSQAGILLWRGASSVG